VHLNRENPPFAAHHGYLHRCRIALQTLKQWNSSGSSTLRAGRRNAGQQAFVFLVGGLGPVTVTCNVSRECVTTHTLAACSRQVAMTCCVPPLLPGAGEGRAVLTGLLLCLVPDPASV
jgi:hypothetical protein